MTTIICAIANAGKVLTMREEGLATRIKQLVILGDIEEEMRARADRVNIRLLTYAEVSGAEANLDDDKKNEPSGDDVFIVNFTSGTTGDPKGVLARHRNMMDIPKVSDIDTGPGDAVLSYMPYPHVYEQMLLVTALYKGMRIGFYQGNPLKLLDDMQTLKPVIFASVPRLYNKIYASISARFQEATGCKKWMLDKAMSAKLANLEATGEVTHCCWDKLIFSKVAQVLGGNVKVMGSGSAPIDKQVVDFIKVCFSCKF